MAIAVKLDDLLHDRRMTLPGDILRFEPAQAKRRRPAAASKRSASR